VAIDTIVAHRECVRLTLLMGTSALRNGLAPVLQAMTAHCDWWSTRSALYGKLVLSHFAQDRRAGACGGELTAEEYALADYACRLPDPHFGTPGRPLHDGRDDAALRRRLIRLGADPERVMAVEGSVQARHAELAERAARVDCEALIECAMRLRGVARSGPGEPSERRAAAS
jgi:hypothetical protein